MNIARIALLVTYFALFAAGAVQANVCSGEQSAQPLPVRTSPVPAVTSSLLGRPVAIASRHVLLTPSRDESLALDVVLLRLKMESCTVDVYSGYKPRTEFDNTPWRYNMEKGKKFTAEEFDAWMKSRGVRVAKGKAEPVAAPVAAAADAPQVVDQ